MASHQRLHPLGVRLGDDPFVRYLHVKPLRRQPQRGAQDQQQQQRGGSVAAAAEQQLHALFVCGLPLGVGEAQLTRLFACFGLLNQVVVHPSQRSAVVQFSEAGGVAACMEAAKQAQLVELPAADDEQEQPQQQGEHAQQDGAAPAGLKAMVLAHKASRPGLDELQTRLDAWTEAHEAAEAARLRAQQEAMAGDGWTVVTRTKGRKRTREDGGVVSQSGGVAAAAAQQALAASLQKKKPVTNFYAYERREKRRNEMLELRKRFEDDRRRIAALRATRNFKPV